MEYGGNLCITICEPQADNQDQDGSLSSLDMNINSLGHCESYLLSQDSKPSLESLTDCYERYTLA